MIDLLLAALCHLTASNVGMPNLHSNFDRGSDCTILHDYKPSALVLLKFNNQFRYAQVIPKSVEDCLILGSSDQKNAIIFTGGLPAPCIYAKSVSVPIMSQVIAGPYGIGLLASEELWRNGLKEAFVHKIAMMTNMQSSPACDIACNRIAGVFGFYVDSANQGITSDGQAAYVCAQLDPRSILGNPALSGNLIASMGGVERGFNKPNTYSAKGHADQRSNAHYLRPPSRDILGSKVVLFALAFACGFICLGRAIFLSESGRGEAVFFYICVGIVLIFYGGVGGGMAIG